MTLKNIERVLNLFYEGSITACEVEAWENALECRDDLAFSDPVVSQILYELANPLLTQLLSLKRAYDLLLLVKLSG